MPRAFGKSEETRLLELFEPLVEGRVDVGEWLNENFIDVYLTIDLRKNILGITLVGSTGGPRVEYVLNGSSITVRECQAFQGCEEHTYRHPMFGDAFDILSEYLEEILQL